MLTGMSYLAGHPPRQERSLWPPALQIVLVLALIATARWSEHHAPSVRATDQWAYNALAVCLYLLGILWLPFAIGALVKVLRNRRHSAEIVRR